MSKKRIRKGIESLERQIYKHSKKLSRAIEDKDVDLVYYYEKEIEKFKKEIEKKKKRL
ncbi:MAG: hypothetical protein QXF56_00410 [Candidatus Micrarchaeia archaeon]